MLSHHLKEDASDIAVKAHLWQASKRELLHLADRYRSEHKPGCRSCRAQEEVCSAASQKGYPISLIRFLGAQKRADGLDQAAHEKIGLWQRRIGLKSGNHVASQ